MHARILSSQLYIYGLQSETCGLRTKHRILEKEMKRVKKTFKYLSFVNIFLYPDDKTNKQIYTKTIQPRIIYM